MARRAPEVRSEPIQGCTAQVTHVTARKAGTLGAQRKKARSMFGASTVPVTPKPSPSKEGSALRIMLPTS